MRSRCFRERRHPAKARLEKPPTNIAHVESLGAAAAPDALMASAILNLSPPIFGSTVAAPDDDHSTAS
jgi:hypothetical protein